VGRLRRELLEEVFYPPHEPRTASAEYGRTHRELVVVRDEPCWICGIRNSDVAKIADRAERRRWQLETHHDELEWAAANGVDLAKVMIDFPSIHDDAGLRAWLDSEGNMLVLCATHHRGARTGIHSITYPAWKLQRWQSPAFSFIEQPPRPAS
jgi:hypothetical protein